MRKVLIGLFTLVCIGVSAQGYATYEPMETPQINLSQGQQSTIPQGDVENVRITGYIAPNALYGEKEWKAVTLDLQIVTQYRISNIYVTAYKPRGNEKVKLARPTYVSKVNPYSNIDFTYTASLPIGTVYFDY